MTSPIEVTVTGKLHGLWRLHLVNAVIRVLPVTRWDHRLVTWAMDQVRVEVTTGTGKLLGYTQVPWHFDNDHMIVLGNPE